MAFGLGQHSFPHTQTGGSKPARSKGNTTPTSPRAPRPTKRPLTSGRVAQLLANPGTRATLPDQYLPPNLLAQRQTNRRLAQPVTPGSSMTERALAQQTNAAADVRYGQALGQARQVSRDVNDYYASYLRELAAHQANVAGYQQQAQQQVQGLSQASGSLPAQGAATGLSAENQQVAGNAAAVRNALVGSFGSMLASQGANANTYASNLAHVVGPGAKLQAQTRAGNNITSLLKERGAYRTQLGDETRQSEAKNVLAQQIATGKTTLDKQQLAETTRAHKASERNAASATKARSQSAGEKVNKYGYSDSEWRGMTVAQRQKIIKDFSGGAGKGKAKKPGRGPGSLTSLQENSVVSQINKAVSLIKRGPTKKVDGKDVKLTGPEIRQAMLNGDSPLGVLDPRLVNIAFDLARKGGLSAPNVKALHQLGVHAGGNFKVLQPSLLPPLPKIPPLHL